MAIFKVGLSLAQISEFAFVLLSIAVDFGLLEVEMYLLLLGVTAVSLLCTPIVISASRSRLLNAMQPLKRTPTTDSGPDEDSNELEVITHSNQVRSFRAQQLSQNMAVQNQSRTSSQNFGNPDAVQKRQSRR